jgi:hypothetical protein
MTGFGTDLFGTGTFGGTAAATSTGGQVHVEGITEDVTVQGSTWLIGFDVSPADPDTDFWELGTTALGATNPLYY